MVSLFYKSTSGKPILAPFVLITIESSSTFEIEDIRRIVGEWAGSTTNEFSNWQALAKANLLLFEDEEGQSPFKVQEVYKGEFRWVTILHPRPEFVELSLGMNVNEFGTPSHSDVANNVNSFVKTIKRELRGYKLWKNINVKAEIMLNRSNSGIKLSAPLTFREILFSFDVLKPLLPLFIAVVGGLISAILSINKAPESVNITANANISAITNTTFDFFFKSLLPASIFLLFAYVVSIIITWKSSRNDLSWKLE
jgi:hypothetical protein